MTNPNSEAKKPVVYTIINPSDPYTLVSSDREVAGLACVLLGNGQYGLHAHDDQGREMDDGGCPLLLFGDAEKIWKDVFGGEDDLSTRIEKNLAAIADVLDTVAIGRWNDRAEYESALAMIDDPAKREAWILRRQEQRRSSMNNIGARAIKFAAAMRAKLPLPAVPQSVFCAAR